MEISPVEFVTIKTTLPKLPFPPNTERRAILTDRLLIRPFRQDDMEALHALRSQPEVMKWSIQGRPDETMDETRKSAALRLPPQDTERYDWVICLASTGEFIGLGGNGMWDGELGWPVLGYMLVKEAWGKGYTSEFLSAFLDAWWDLPREEVEIKVDANSVRGEGEIKKEMMSGITTDDNKASQNVMRKAGFELVSVFEEEDLRDSDAMVTLYGYVVGKKDIV